MMWSVGMDPWRELERMRREMDSLFSGRSAVSRSFPLVNVHDAGELVVVNAELPGMAREDVKIVLNDNVLTLSGDRKTPKEAAKMTPVRRERATGAFEKAISIPVRVVSDGIKATFRNGILTVTLPKAEEAKPRQIAIETA
jgi:HSP20 family protein